MSHITLPRAVGLHIRNSLRGIVNASDDDCGEEKCRDCAPVRVMREALAALDAALAEPDAIALLTEVRDALRRMDPAWCVLHGQEQLAEWELDDLLERVEDAVEDGDGTPT